MTLGTLKKHLAELEEQGATDDSEVKILDLGYFVHIDHIEFVDNDILIIP